ncbi:transcriptional coactivator YAP1-like [Dunckerocampus dactyliophorus]|uniref:transcriptional coactivator YAP1-like n=1 Tax=Dunckerocampus dactyliophorus TaxID=161453 RepID=UPI002406615B|nr:transcriptional coactivator YAP1-like [Dunckerocampus dactyliophorus]XP_054612047.1 transcriptional coactivator YAP1-like [Dunckerocampus dactyliophorus]
MDAHRGAPPAGQQVVHVRGDSQTELEALFSAVMNPSKAAQQPASLPMRMRKLPDSFFRQPDSRTHSRQASSDGGACASLTPHHVRAHSSPASLPVNMPDAAAPPVIPDDMPLPHGWEMAKTSTGQRYFLNHLDKTTTWHDPRLAQLQSAAAQHPSPAPIHAHSLSNPATASTPQSINLDAAQKMNPGLLSLAVQQRQEKERLQRCKQQMQPPQDTGGRSQMAGGMDHDRNNALVPSADVRIRAQTHEPTLNGAHSRNESTDSGLSVSSLPRTSDHMLSSVDHMDTGDSAESSSMTLQDTMPAMTEGEELMPCIPEGLSSELLMDMETVLSGSHMDRDSLLTWL